MSGNVNTQSDYFYLSLRAPATQHETLAVVLNELAGTESEGAWSEGETLHLFYPAESTTAGNLQLAAGELLAQSPLGERADILGVSLQPGTNWNAKWEAEYPEIEIRDFVQVVPHFRKPKPGFRHTLSITAEMAFGTGHHATTRLMMELMANYTWQGTRVLDHGCGTGILGILAGKMGAGNLYLSDYDTVSTQSATENLARNNIEPATVLTGTIRTIELPAEQQFDFLLANINRNVLLSEAELYASRIVPGGYLLLSGFLVVDFEQILGYFSEYGFLLHTRISEGEWCAASFLMQPPA